MKIIYKESLWKVSKVVALEKETINSREIKLF